MVANINVGDPFGTLKEVQELIVFSEKFVCINYNVVDE
jgi:hypothetical protein